MNLIPRSLTDWLWPLFERFAAFGVRTSLVEGAVNLAEAANAARERGLQSTLKSIDSANGLDDGDEDKRKAIAIFNRATVDQARVLVRLMEEPIALADAERALDDPFGDATPTGTSLPAASQPPALEAPEKGREQARDATDQERPVRRGRGRPKGSRNRPKPEGMNGQAQAAPGTHRSEGPSPNGD